MITEKLGQFYIGKNYDSESDKVLDTPVNYDSKDLTTHGVCIGMTGSGKTGLCLSLLEEAAIDNIPVIAIDPKGDITNLFLTFPDLSPEEFKPWVSEDEASQNGITVESLAEKKADLWTKGLEKWGQSGDRIKLFEDSAERLLYTPGSSSARPLSILKSFTRPAGIDDFEVIADRIATMVSGLLGLLDIDADPINSKEHILLSNIIQHEWNDDRDVPVETLISLIQKPPVSKIGALDLESYYPSKERFKLATSINNLIASPQFAIWTKGESINIDDLFYSESGKPRISVLSIAHLDDKERMFFVTLFLNELISWMRRQNGTSSLRCILYMDEIFGYLPPVANPPTKPLFLTLLKQARAVGLGLLLATQNPGDLDYKALSNVGTWFIGRLQTERDKEKVLEGLVSANSGADKKEISRELAGLGKRVFMLNNVSDDHPYLFHTRWALSYLAGPITNARFSELTGEDYSKIIAAEEDEEKETSEASDTQTTRPVIPPGIPEAFFPGSGNYQPKAVGFAQAYYKDSKLGISETIDFSRIADVGTNVNWQESKPLDLAIDDIENEPRDGIEFRKADLDITEKSVKLWEKDLTLWIYRDKPLTIYFCDDLDEYSTPGEDERSFRVRLSQMVRERRDEAVAKIREDYAKEIDRLERKMASAESKAATQKAQASSHMWGTALSIGTSVISSIFSSRKGVSGIARSAQRIGTTMKERREAEAAEESIEEINEKFLEIEEEIKSKVESFTNVDAITIESIDIKPNKSDITIKKVALGWIPE